MSRPSTPRILQGNITELDLVEILEAPTQWAVIYQDRLIRILRSRLYRNRKYLRTMFASEAAARNLAAKLNHLFNTNDFAVREMK